MPAFRLVFLVAVVVGLLFAIATSSSQRDRANRDAPPTTATTATSIPREPSRVVTARLPRTAPIDARVGDLVAISFTPREADIVELDAFGVREGFAAGVPTVLRFVAARPGTFSLHLRQADRALARLVVTRPRLLTGGTAPDSGTRTASR